MYLQRTTNLITWRILSYQMLTVVPTDRSVFETIFTWLPETEISAPKHLFVGENVTICCESWATSTLTVMYMPYTCSIRLYYYYIVLLYTILVTVYTRYIYVHVFCLPRCHYLIYLLKFRQNTLMCHQVPLGNILAVILDSTYRAIFEIPLIITNDRAYLKIPRRHRNRELVPILPKMLKNYYFTLLDKWRQSCILLRIQLCTFWPHH